MTDGLRRLFITRCLFQLDSMFRGLLASAMGLCAQVSQATMLGSEGRKLCWMNSPEAFGRLCQSWGGHVSIGFFTVFCCFGAWKILYILDVCWPSSTQSCLRGCASTRRPPYTFRPSALQGEEAVAQALTPTSVSSRNNAMVVTRASVEAKRSLWYYCGAVELKVA